MVEENSCLGKIMKEGEDPGFFKILRKSDLSSETMRGIPHGFVKCLSDEDFSVDMMLKVSWGSSWPIKISRNSRFYYMEKSGWDKFLSDNGLGNDEFLSFTHKGHMCVNVDIYQIDGKEMLTPLKSAPLASSSSCQNKRDQGNYIDKDVEKEEAIGREQKKANTDSGADTSSLVPEFTISIKKAYLMFLAVPKKFADTHMPKETKRFKIHLLNETKSWEVLYLVDTQSRFSAGWVRLVKELGLVVGDFCTFKLTKPTEMLLIVSKERLHDDDVYIV